MEDGNSLYPWFIFILIIASYLLRVVRSIKKRAQEAKQKKREQSSVSQSFPKAKKNKEAAAAAFDQNNNSGFITPPKSISNLSTAYNSN